MKVDTMQPHAQPRNSKGSPGAGQWRPDTDRGGAADMPSGTPADAGSELREDIIAQWNDVHTGTWTASLLPDHDLVVMQGEEFVDVLDISPATIDADVREQALEEYSFTDSFAVSSDHETLYIDGDWYKFKHRDQDWFLSHSVDLGEHHRKVGAETAAAVLPGVESVRCDVWNGERIITQAWDGDGREFDADTPEIAALNASPARKQLGRASAMLFRDGERMKLVLPDLADSDSVPSHDEVRADPDAHAKSADSAWELAVNLRSREIATKAMYDAQYDCPDAAAVEFGLGDSGAWEPVSLVDAQGSPVAAPGSAAWDAFATTDHYESIVELGRLTGPRTAKLAFPTF